MTRAAPCLPKQGQDAGVVLNFRKRPAHESAIDAQVCIHSVVIAGFTGRNTEAVQAHIAELEEIGVKRPATVPVFYRISPMNMSTSNTQYVLGEETSGEVEFVVCKLADGPWIGVGSDHTDRDAEARYGVALSKQLCCKPVAPELWRWSDVAEHWDQLTLRSWATIGSRRVLYQQGAVSAMLNPNDLQATHDRQHGELPEGSAMFCGTFAVEGGPRPASRFEFELSDPVLGRAIKHEYAIHTLPVRT